jgi:signal peptidase I
MLSLFAREGDVVLPLTSQDILSEADMDEMLSILDTCPLPSRRGGNFPAGQRAPANGLQPDGDGDFMEELMGLLGGGVPLEGLPPFYGPGVFPPQAAHGMSVRKARARSRFTGFLLYAALIAAVLGAYLFHNGTDGAPQDFLGYSAMTVLTPSMQGEIPMGSLVVTKKVDRSALNVGDDITFLKKDKTTVTHRIVEVFANYEGTGEIAFRTKGVENDYTDRDIVMGYNVIGKVIFHSQAAGRAVSFVKGHVIVIAVMAALLVGLAVVLGAIKRTPTGPKRKRPRRAGVKGKQLATA